MMTYKQLQAAAKLSNAAAADLFKVNLSTVFRWKNGSVKAPEAVRLLLLERLAEGKL